MERPSLDIVAESLANSYTMGNKRYAIDALLTDDWPTEAARAYAITRTRAYLDGPTALSFDRYLAQRAGIL